MQKKKGHTHVTKRYKRMIAGFIAFIFIFSNSASAFEALAAGEGGSKPEVTHTTSKEKTAADVIAAIATGANVTDETDELSLTIGKFLCTYNTGSGTSTGALQAASSEEGTSIWELPEGATALNLESIEMSLQFKVLKDEGRTLKAGDYFEFTLPECFSGQETVNEEFKIGDDVILLFSLIQDGTQWKIIGVFTEHIEIDKGMYGIQGGITENFNLSISDAQKKVGADITMLTTNDGKSHILRIPAAPTKVNGITKTGTLDPETNQIAWEITIGTDSAVGVSLENIVVTDTIGTVAYIGGIETEAQKYIENSAKLGDQGIALVKVDDATYTYTFGEGVTAPQVITYRTQVQESILKQAMQSKETEYKLTNAVALSADESDSGRLGNEKTASAEVALPKQVVSKQGSQISSDRIGWYITVNDCDPAYNMYHAVVTDCLEKGLEVDMNSIRIIQISSESAQTIRKDGVVPTEDSGSNTYNWGDEFFCNLTVADEAQTLDIYFPNVVKTGYTIYFETVIGTGFVSTDANAASILNNATIRTQIPVGGGYGERIDWGTGPINAEFLTAYIEKDTPEGSAGFDAQTGEITWNLRASTRAKAYETAVITDVIEKNQEFDRDSVVFRKVNSDGTLGNIVTFESNQMEQTYVEASRTLTITFKNGTNFNDINIQYKTKALNYWKENYTEATYTNTASITVSKSRTSYEDTDSATRTEQNPLLSKTSEYVYDDAENKGYFHYIIEYNKNQLALTGAVLTDALDSAEYSIIKTELPAVDVTDLFSLVKTGDKAPKLYKMERGESAYALVANPTIAYNEENLSLPKVTATIGNTTASYQLEIYVELNKAGLLTEEGWSENSSISTYGDKIISKNKVTQTATNFNNGVEISVEDITEEEDGIDNTLIHKSGKLNTEGDDKGTITWTIDINPNGLPLTSNLNTVMIEDVVSSDLKIIRESVKLYKGTHSETGADITGSGDVVDPTVIAYVFDKASGNTTMNLTVPESNMPYRLVFNTAIANDAIGISASNMATLKVNTNQVNSNNMEVNLSAGNWITGRSVSIFTFTVQDRLSSNIKLSDVVYGLYSDASCTEEHLVDQAVSDANGTIKLLGKKNTDFWIKEIETNGKYQLSTDVVKVMTTSGGPVQVITDADGNRVVFQNERIQSTGAKAIIKKQYLDKNADAIAGEYDYKSTFELYIYPENAEGTKNLKVVLKKDGDGEYTYIGTGEATGENTNEICSAAISSSANPGQLVINNLPWGTYRMVETATAEGYIVSDLIYSFTVTQEGERWNVVYDFGSSLESHDGVISNSPNKVTFRKKFSAEALECVTEVEGLTAYFTLYEKTSDPETLAVAQNLLTGKEYKDIMVSSQDLKEVVFTNLKTGTYVLKELNQDSNDNVTSEVLKLDSVEFSIDSKGKVTMDGKSLRDPTIEMENEPISVTVKKCDQFQMGVVNATIQIIRQEDGALDGCKDQSQTTTSDGNGDTLITFTGLKRGKTYKIQESVTPEGYFKAEAITITIAEDGTLASVVDSNGANLANQSESQDSASLRSNLVIDQSASTVLMRDVKKVQNLALKKVSSANVDTAIAGVQFKIMKSDGAAGKDGDVEIATITTDENGVGTYSNLEIGDYYLVETYTPAEYLLPEENTIYPFSVNADAFIDVAATYTNWVGLDADGTVQSTIVTTPGMPTGYQAITNRPMNTVLKVKKVDSNNTGLAGVQFKLQVTPVIATGTGASETIDCITDANGDLKLKNNDGSAGEDISLVRGSYILTETKTVAGYKLSNKLSGQSTTAQNGVFRCTFDVDNESFGKNVYIAPEGSTITGGDGNIIAKGLVITGNSGSLVTTDYKAEDSRIVNEPISISITKKANDDNSALQGVLFTIAGTFAKEDGTIEEKTLTTLPTGSDGTVALNVDTLVDNDVKYRLISSTSEKNYIYTLTESQSVAGYAKHAAFDFIVDENGWVKAIDNGTTYEGVSFQETNITVVDKLDTVDLKLTKNWEDYSNAYSLRPTVEAFQQNNIKLQYRIDDTGSWKDLVGNADGIKKDFSTSSDAKDTHIITSYVAQDNSTEYTYSYLQKYTKDTGKEISYRIVETTIPVGYVNNDVDASGNRVLTNTIDTLTLHMESTWADGDDEYEVRPDAIEVKIQQRIINDDSDDEKDENWTDSFAYSDGSTTSTGLKVTITEDDDWKKAVAGLQKYDAEGKLHKYRVVYTNNNYVTTYEMGENDNIRNVVIQNTLSENGHRYVINTVWADTDNQYHTRPKEIVYVIQSRKYGDQTSVWETVRKNAQDYKVTLTAKNQLANDSNIWQANVFGLPLYTGSGAELEYRAVEEGTIAGYDGEGTTTVAPVHNWSEKISTYTHALDRVKVTAIKRWIDQNNIYGVRPTISALQPTDNVLGFQLYYSYKNESGSDITAKMDVNTYTGTWTTNAQDSNIWNWTIEGLPKYVRVPTGDAEYVYPVTYSVKEENAITGYTNTLELQTTVENTLNVLDICVTKNWVDDNDENSLRPNPIRDGLDLKLERSIDGLVWEDITALYVQQNRNKPVWTDNNDNTWTCTYVALPKQVNVNGTSVTYQYRIVENTDAHTSGPLDAYEAEVPTDIVSAADAVEREGYHDTVQASLTNIIKHGYFQMNKVYGEVGENVVNGQSVERPIATFALYKGVVTLEEIEDGRAQVWHTLRTNAQGTFSIENGKYLEATAENVDFYVPEGTYSIVETAVSDSNYSVYTEVTTFQVTVQNTLENPVIVSNATGNLYVNEAKRGKITLTKFDSAYRLDDNGNLVARSVDGDNGPYTEDGIRLDGAVFKLCLDSAGTNVITELVQNTGDEAVTAGEYVLPQNPVGVTEALVNALGIPYLYNGQLLYGDYYIVESTAPIGYIASTVNPKVTIRNSDSATLVDVPVAMENALITQLFHVQKTYEEPNAQALDQTGEQVKAGLHQFTFTMRRLDGQTPAFQYSKTVTTNENGVADFGLIPYGQYELSEGAVDAFQAVAPKVITVDGDGVHYNGSKLENGKLAVGTTLKRSTITGLTKEDVASEEAVYGIGNAVMGLFRNSEDAEPLLQAVTDLDGVYTFANVPYGSYVIREVDAPDHYQLSTQQVVANITAQGTVVNVVDITNAQIKTALVLQDQGVDGALRTALSNVRFTLAGRDFKNHEVVLEGNTDLLGNLTFANLVSGNYTLTAAKVEDYSQPKVMRVVISSVADGADNRAVIEIADEEGNGLVPENTGIYTIINDLIRRRFAFTLFAKNDELDLEKKTELAGITYGVFHDALCTQLIEAQVSGLDGSITFDSLKCGEYYIKELVSENIYEKNDTVYQITVNQDGTITDTFENKRVVNETKRSAFHMTNALSGSTYGLYRKVENADEVTSGSDGPEGYVKVTEELADEEGMATFSNLLVGAEYIVMELNVPEGYQVSEKYIAFQFEIAADESFVELIIKNDANDTVLLDEAGNVIWFDPVIQSGTGNVGTGDAYRRMRWILLAGLSMAIMMLMMGLSSRRNKKVSK